MYYVPLPVVVAPNEISSDEISGEGPKILMIGKYHQERKKHGLFLQALHQLKDRYHFKATMVGECVSDAQRLKFETIRLETNNLGLAGLVELKKNVPYNKMEALYATHHIFVLPAVNEQYGVSVNEAMGYALPVICTDTCGAKFNVFNGKNGYVIKSGSVEELKAALEQLISDHHKLYQMRRQSLQYAKDNLSADAFYERFTHMIRERFSIQMS
jgi:glycosyltransferase involved in cell wall biosynthesis